MHLQMECFLPFRCWAAAEDPVPNKCLHEINGSKDDDDAFIFALFLNLSGIYTQIS